MKGARHVCYKCSQSAVSPAWAGLKAERLWLIAWCER